MSPTDERVNGGRIVVECIRRAGTTHAFCVPGESYLPIMDAFLEAPELTLVSCRHEGGAGFAAEAYAKATGRPGVCLATRGPGAFNLAIGLHTAMQDSTPVVAFIGQVETARRGREAFQEVEHAEVFRSVVKWSVEVNRTDRLPELVSKAFRVAASGRPGPVVVALPSDVLFGTAVPRYPSGRWYPARPRPAAEAVQQALDWLVRAERPAILAGGGVLASKATAELVQVAEELGIPVWTGWRRFDAFPNDHGHYVGGMSLGVRPELLRPLKEADVVLAIGTRLGDITTQSYSVPTGRIIHVDLSPDVLGEAATALPAEAWLPVASDARAFAGALAEAARAAGFRRQPEHARRMERVAVLRAQFEEVSTPKERRGHALVHPEGVIADLARLLPAEAAIVTDAGNFSGWYSRYYRFRQPGTHFGPTSGAMGYAVPGALGVALAGPPRPVVAMAGDGGFLMTAAELETAVRHQAGFVALVFNNGLYGTIRAHQEKNFPGRYPGTALGNPDFAALARSFGAWGAVIETNDAFAGAMKEALAVSQGQAGGPPRPAVIELRTDPALLSAAAQK